VTLSGELERWLDSESSTSVGGLMEVFGDKSFALLFVFLLGVSALPLPTGGATHVLEVIAALLALELVVGRRQVWLPERWRGLDLAGPRRQRLIAGLMRLIRWLERYSRPRLVAVFRWRFSRMCFGLLVLGGTVGAFFAPPFSGLDTLPSLGVVLLALGWLLEDAVVVVVGLVLGVAGVVLEIVLGSAAIHALSNLV
jgi:hypothetical protein